jgi:gliding motility-associated protein GldM
MSIPKEPRQLMINLMYLVLMALLALNVSAEIINAFFQIDKGIKSSNAIMDQSNGITSTFIEKNAEQDLSKYQPLVDAAKEVRAISAEFTTYFDERREELVEETHKGYYPDDDVKHAGQPKGYKDKDVTTRVLVYGYQKDGKKVEPKGPEIENKVKDTKAKILSIINELKGIKGTNITDETIKELEQSISLEIDTDWEKSDKKSWAEFTFKKMPLAAVFPIFRKFQNDMKSTEAAVLNFLSGQIGASTFKVDNFIPISSAEKSYVLVGQPFKAEITIGASSKSVYDNMSINVNGQSLPAVNGVASYTATSSSPGTKDYKVSISLTNPTTGERESYEKNFQYEVGLGSAAVAADKMNVFYIGVDNPISISAGGTSTNSLNVSCTGCKLSGRGLNRIVTVDRQGEATVTVSGDNLKPTPFKFRTKRIPDPVPMLGNNAGGEMGTGEFKAQGGLLAVLKDFDFDARCTVQGFNFVYTPKREDPVVVTNGGAKYVEQAQRLVQRAKSGDSYAFENIKAKCPGDEAGRPLGSISFRIR